ncbi:lipoprotein [Paractinoplanes brasiliensis]|uniref:Lipoprotein n=1 Tax=Paractinoplanes brasiliensis TaxID=52695 RepID=A0A4R6JWB9_9ACTN|nr:lipoprotein [Actinoplanes brasiliensis]TDO41063.1 hypothetical protein C8E87_4790 [Actinoplanes brasiliensis]
MRLLALAGLGAAVLALTACESNESVWTAPGTPPASSAASSAGPSAAPSVVQPAASEAARVGASGSGCELPVTFGLAESYKPKAVKVEAGSALAELAERGPFTMVCEIDAKPAGNIGFLRVYTGSSDDLRAGLTAFAGDDAQGLLFRNVRLGALTGSEVRYKAKDPVEGALEQERAFAVRAGSDVVVVALDSFDSGEHQAMLPAYELAKVSLRPAS